jgi:hypothetical protein
MDNTLKNLKEIKIDAMYGKKKHFNAADRKANYHKRIGITLLIFNITTSSVLFYLIFSDTNGAIQFISAIIALGATLLGGVQTFFNFPKQVEGHRRVANTYLALMKECVRLEGYFKDKLSSGDNMIDKIERIAKLINETNCEAESFPTNDADYRKAQKGFEQGEESYKESELSL